MPTIRRMLKEFVAHEYVVDVSVEYQSSSHLLTVFKQTVRS